MNFIDGERILIYKPREWSSFDLVRKVRNLIHKHTGVKVKVGHAGTLDPLAEGLMIICTGKKTKELTSFQGDEKEYIARIEFGATTPSFDLETQIDNRFPFEHITLELLQNTLKNFIGVQLQNPPIFSAKKVNGQRAYKKARKGKSINIEPVSIEYKSFEIISFNLPVLEVKILCSKGTYIRSFAYDLGAALNSGGHLTGLKRTKSGIFNIEDSYTVENIEQLVANNNQTV